MTMWSFRMTMWSFRMTMWSFRMTAGAQDDSVVNKKKPLGFKLPCGFQKFCYLKIR